MEILQCYCGYNLEPTQFFHLQYRSTLTEQWTKTILSGQQWVMETPEVKSQLYYFHSKGLLKTCKKS